MGIYAYRGKICLYGHEYSYGHDCLNIYAYMGIYYLGILFMPIGIYAHTGILGINAHKGPYGHKCLYRHKCRYEARWDTLEYPRTFLSK